MVANYDGLNIVKEIYVDKFSNYVEIRMPTGEIIAFSTKKFFEEVTE